MTSTLTIITTVIAVILQLMSLGVCRQMCYTCQYVLNGKGVGCATSALNWTGGAIRMRCPYSCTIHAEYDAVTGQPTFFQRGCGIVPPDHKDGCTDLGARHNCFYSCGDGHDYCNDKALPRSPIMGKGKDEDKDNPGGGSTCQQMSSLPFMAAVQAVFLLICRTIFRS